MALIGLCAAASHVSAQSATDKVICVPWQGDPTKYHTAISGQSVKVKAVVKPSDASTRWYKWVFGDGNESAVSTLSGVTKIGKDYTYTGFTGLSYTATLKVVATNPTEAPTVWNTALSCSYLVRLEDSASLDAKINMAIDRGLWWLYTNNSTDSYLYSYNGQPVMAWAQWSYGSFWASPTASAIQAFAINNHKYNGDPDKDPYVEAVRLGMNWLTNGYRYYASSPMLDTVSIAPISRGESPTVYDDPEAGQASPNGFGIQVHDWDNSHFPYQGGQIMDAIIASGVLPNDLTGRDFSKTDGTIGTNCTWASTTDKSCNWTYKDLLQDMADMYSWGQSDDSCNGGTCGSWWYGWNYSSGDNSASQWAAIGMIPGQQAPWNIIVPQWVKTYNANWLAASYCSSYGYFGYNDACGCAGDSCEQTTTSGMVQMAFVGQIGYDDPSTTADERDSKWVGGEKYIADNWSDFLTSGSGWGGPRTYGWYSFAKAMRLAVPHQIDTIKTSGGTAFDWYRGTGSINGLAQRIVEIQAADGHWDGNLTNSPLTTAWMVITLKPALFRASPIPCFKANPNPSYADVPVHFDPSCSGHAETGKTISNLTNFEWDWNNDGVYDTTTTAPSIVTHAFSCTNFPCTYPVHLKVTDDASLTAATAVNIVISNPPHPPVANAGGPYMLSQCSNDSQTLTLDGSKSYHPDQGWCENCLKAGDPGCPCRNPDQIISWSWGLNQNNVNNFADKQGDTVTLTSDEIKNYFIAGRVANNVGLQVTDNTSLSFAGAQSPNLKSQNFTTVQYSLSGICNLAASGKLGKVQLKWAPTGPSNSYDIYRSEKGPNTGFNKIASVTAYPAYQDNFDVTNVANVKTYYYRVVDSTGKGSQAAKAIPYSKATRHLLEGEE